MLGFCGKSEYVSDGGTRRNDGKQQAQVYSPFRRPNQAGYERAGADPRFSGSTESER